MDTITRTGAMSKVKIGLLFNLPTQLARGEAVDYVAERAVEEQVDAVQDALEALDLEYERLPLKDDVHFLIRALKTSTPDVIINLCEEVSGDSHQEMNVPALLELFGIPYTGSPPLTLGLCQNKGLTKDILQAKGIPTPKFQVLHSFHDWKGGIDPPLFVKPLQEDASIGISPNSFVQTDAELKAQVDYILRRYRQPALVEEYIAGREFNVALLSTNKLRVLPVSEVIFECLNHPKIRDYSSKWIRESEEYGRTKVVCPARYEPSLQDRVERVAVDAYTALHCRDYARVDLRLKDDQPQVLEVNPNPDISYDSSYALSLRTAEIPFEEFIHRIVSSALRRKPEE